MKKILFFLILALVVDEGYVSITHGFGTQGMVRRGLGCERGDYKC